MNIERLERLERLERTVDKARSMLVQIVGNVTCVLILSSGCTNGEPSSEVKSEAATKRGYVSEITFNVDPGNGIIPLSWQRLNLYYVMVCFTDTLMPESEACFTDQDGLTIRYREDGTILQFRADWKDGHLSGWGNSFGGDDAFLTSLKLAMSTEGVLVTMLDPRDEGPKDERLGDLNFPFRVEPPSSVFSRPVHRAIAREMNRTDPQFYDNSETVYLTKDTFLDGNGDLRVSRWEVFSDLWWAPASSPQP